MRATVSALIALGPQASREQRRAALRRCIESFNELDARSRFIGSIERDDICEEFDAIAHACGLGDEEDLAHRWRDW